MPMRPPESSASRISVAVTIVRPPSGGSTAYVAAAAPCRASPSRPRASARRRQKRRGRKSRDQRENRRSEEHTSELQSLMRISYAVFCLKKKKKNKTTTLKYEL